MDMDKKMDTKVLYPVIIFSMNIGFFRAVGHNSWHPALNSAQMLRNEKLSTYFVRFHTEKNILAVPAK
jgi:hypothetical protein